MVLSDDVDTVKGDDMEVQDEACRREARLGDKGTSRWRYKTETRGDQMRSARSLKGTHVVDPSEESIHREGSSTLRHRNRRPG